MERITLTKPDDWHLHLREGSAMKSVVGMSALQMAPQPGVIWIAAAVMVGTWYP